MTHKGVCSSYNFMKGHDATCVISDKCMYRLLCMCVRISAILGQLRDIQ